jgi:site-specific recombinase XerD
MELPAKEHFERYMRHKWRLNHKPRTLASSFTSVMLLLDFYGRSGKREMEKIERVDLEAFIEHEQDRGLRISTVRTRLAGSRCSILAILTPLSTRRNSIR